MCIVGVESEIVLLQSEEALEDLDDFLIDFRRFVVLQHLQPFEEARQTLQTLIDQVGRSHFSTHF